MKLNLFNIAKELFPLNRSITGKDTLKTLEYIRNIIPELKIKKIKSGEKVFDWKVPDEWNVEEGYIKDSNDKDVINFKTNNLHVMGYSESINKTMSLTQLDKHLYTIKDQPDAIPFVTSYYKKNWGFCMSYNQRKKLKKGKYKVFINSSFNKNGLMHYGEIKIKGKSKKEILITSNICHPSMANNELSGVVVLISVTKKILKFNNRNYSYRILFIPETIGSIAYISKNFNELKNKIFAGYVINCLGDNGIFSHIPSRYGDTISDKAIEFTFKNYINNYKRYSFLDRGSDERQFGSPGVDLPICSISRSKYGEYPEYHTSLDNLSIISNKYLNESSNLIIKIIKIIEINTTYIHTKLGEPFLTKYNLYPSISSKNHLFKNTQLILDILAYSDGKNDLIDLANIIKKDIFEIKEVVDILFQNKLLKYYKNTDNLLNKIKSFSDKELLEILS
tara:strand:+ start:4274 stop:5620 length:1347 start_codon:yes stop_codon:yes gene_type:complete